MTRQQVRVDDAPTHPLPTAYHIGREPSFTAMWHAWLRNRHATAHASPIFTDTRSVQLVPAEVRLRVDSVMDGFTRETADSIVLMSVIRYRVFSERLAQANLQGVRQLVILGAGLDTTAFALPPWADDWRVFEVDHPATQEWKRARIAELGWSTAANHVFVPCDFETHSLATALGSACFDVTQPAMLSLFGVALYLTVQATRILFRQVASIARKSEVTISYCPPPDGTDHVADETFRKASPTVDATGESFLNFYSASDIERLTRDAGFSAVIHHPLSELNTRYFDGRPDGLRLHPIEQLLTAIV